MPFARWMSYRHRRSIRRRVFIGRFSNCSPAECTPSCGGRTHATTAGTSGYVTPSYTMRAGDGLPFREGAVDQDAGASAGDIVDLARQLQVGFGDVHLELDVHASLAAQRQPGDLGDVVVKIVTVQRYGEHVVAAAAFELLEYLAGNHRGQHHHDVHVRELGVVLDGLAQLVTAAASQVYVDDGEDGALVAHHGQGPRRGTWRRRAGRPVAGMVPSRGGGRLQRCSWLRRATSDGS